MREREEAIHLTIESIWSQMFGLWAVPDGVLLHDDLAGDVPERASVLMRGQSDVEIVLHCSMPLATVLAGLMFDVILEAVDDELRADTMGELVNILAGNVKVILPTPTQLSLPVTSCPGTGVTGWPLAAAVRYRCLDEPFLVSIRIAEPIFTPA